jgi:hypothetical protein
MTPPGLTIPGRGSTTPQHTQLTQQTRATNGLCGRWLVTPLKSKWTDHPPVTTYKRGHTCR